MLRNLKKAVSQFADIARSQGATVDLTNVDFEALAEAIKEEKEAGASGTLLEFITDFNDSVGLDEFGIVIDE